MPPPSPPHPGSEGQVEVPSLTTANFFLSCCDFVGLRQIESEQLGDNHELFLIWKTAWQSPEGLAAHGDHPLFTYGN